MPVSLQVHVRSFTVDRRRFLKLAQAVLELIDESAAEMHVSFVGDRRMRRLNHRFRHKDRTTDVLAFAYREAQAPHAVHGAAVHLGDLVVALPTAQRQAKAAHRSLDREVAALLVHGVLHLCGYDHERGRAEALRMQRKERQLLRRLGPLTRFIRAAHLHPVPTLREA